MCRGAQDPSSPLEEQAAAAAIHLTGGASVVTWMPNVSFMRVREVAARWPLPSFLTGALGTRVVVTLAGRNLSTWTNYRGLDPEISFAPPSALPRQDWFALPLPRRFVVRIDVAQRSR